MYSFQPRNSKNSVWTAGVMTRPTGQIWLPRVEHFLAYGSIPPIRDYRVLVCREDDPLVCDPESNPEWRQHEPDLFQV